MSSRQDHEYLRSREALVSILDVLLSILFPKTGVVLDHSVASLEYVIECVNAGKLPQSFFIFQCPLGKQYVLIVEDGEGQTASQFVERRQYPLGRSFESLLQHQIFCA